MRLIPWLDRLSSRPRSLRGELRHTRGRARLRWRVAEVESLEDRTQPTAFTYVAEDVPLDVPLLAKTIATINVSDDFLVHHVIVQLNIEHTYDSDLAVFLISPDGTRVELFAEIGGADDNFFDTILDAQADESIDAAVAPFSGTFRPTGDLSEFIGLPTQGDWQLEITDFFQEDSGTLLSWSLNLNDTTYSAVDVPLFVSYEYFGPTTSSIAVADDFVVQDVNVELDIEHTFDRDLEVFLIAPDGTRIKLFAAIGNDRDNFFATVLDQQADQSIADANAPFTGTFRPLGDLSVFIGQQSLGDWQLEITDLFQGDSGALLSWNLILDDVGMEVGGTLETAQFVTNNLSTTGAIDTKSDVDIYAIDLDVGATMTISLQTPSSDFDGSLHIFDKFGNEIAANMDFGDSRDPRVTFTAMTSGVYFIGISSAGNETYNPISGDSEAGSSDGTYQQSNHWSSTIATPSTAS